MDDTKFESSDQSQMRAAGKVYGDAYFGDTYDSNAPREIVVSGVGGTPPSFERYWVDRTTYQTLLTDRLNANPVTEIVAEGGFGKSSLAAWAFENLKGDFKKRLWIDFRVPPTFRDVVRWILQEIGIRYDVQKPSPEILLQELLYRLNDPNIPVKTLVILDQLESLADSSDRPWFEQFLLQWAEQGKESRILVTTRSQVLSQEPIALVGFDQAEGSTFLGRKGLTGDRFSELIGLTGGHPLWLLLAASWTRKTYDSQVDDRAIDFFTKLFANYKGDPKAGVSAIFDVIFEALPIALQELLCRLSVYRLPFDEVMAIAMVAEATIGELEELAGQGLLLAQGDRFVLHPLVAGLVRSRVTEAVRRDGHERAIGYYSAHYQECDGTIESCRERLESFYHACELGQYDRAYLISEHFYYFLKRSSYKGVLFSCYSYLKESYFKEYWKLTQDEKKHFAAVLVSLGNFHNQKNDGQALELYSQALDIALEIQNKRLEAIVRNNLGSANLLIKQYERTVEECEKSIAIAKQINDEIEAHALKNIGLSYAARSNYKQAIKYYKKSISVTEKFRNLESIECAAKSYFNLGYAEAMIDNKIASEPAYRSAIFLYKILQDNNSVQRCEKAIQNIPYIIPYQCHKVDKNTIDWYEKQRQLNQPKTYTATELSAMNRKLFLWFCVVIAIVLVIAWLRK
jgi:tetratricopeptide (TPR) repeat protein